MGAIVSIKKGTYRAQVEHLGKREYRTFRTKTLANSWITQREAEIQQGQLVSTHEARPD